MQKLTPTQQIDQFVSELKKIKDSSFMAGMSKEEELKYALHNKERFIAAIENIDLILSKSTGKVTLLDIGTSPLTFILRKRYPQLDITTLDMTEGLRERCKKNNVKFVKADLNKTQGLPKNKKYNIILFLEVLEHLKSNHQTIIKWVSQILEDNGACILQTPNKYSLKILILNIIGMPLWDLISKRPQSPEEFAHSKEYSLSELKDLINKFPDLSITQASHPIYFDTLSSSLVYRKFASPTKPLLFIHYLIASLSPILRRGMVVIFTKNPTDKTLFGLPPSPFSPEVVKAGVNEIVSAVKKSINKPLKEISVLDAGCGRGEYASAMAKYFKKVVGVEPQKNAYDYATKNYSKQKNLKFYNSTVEDFKTTEKFDLVISLTVFEHVAKRKQFFDRIFSSLEKDGVLYLTAPNKYWIFEQHYGLPFLSWLPLKLANKYLNLTKNISSYEDCSYSLGYRGMQNFFRQYKCSYKFILPFNEESEYFGCNRKGLSSQIRIFGIKLIRLNSIFWNFSKGFIIIVRKSA